MEGHGRTINTALRVDSQGPLFAQIHGTGDWVSNKGAKVLREDTTIRVYNTPDTARVMDFTTRWTAAYGGVFFGDTKEAGTVSIRLMESMEERKGGTIHNAFGAIGEAENWGKCAPWVDYYGPVEDRIWEQATQRPGRPPLDGGAAWSADVRSALAAAVDRVGAGSGG